MPRKKRRPEPVRFSEEQLARRRAGRVTLRELAEAHGVSVHTVWRELNRLGLRGVRPRGRAADQEKHGRVLVLAGAGHSLQEIAQETALSHEGVRRILAQHGRPTTPRVFHCTRCGAALVAGKQVKHDPHALCLDCLAREPDATPGQRLKANRVAGRLTRKDLAARTGLSPHIIRMWESEKSEPPEESLRKLERALEACLEVLKENGQHLS